MDYRRDDAAELPLWSRHLDELRASGLTDDSIRANGLHTSYDKVEVAEILNQLPDGAGKQIPEFCGMGGIAGLIFPYRNLAGEVNCFARVKPCFPRIRDGKPVKYEQPKGSTPRAYYPVASLHKLRDGESPIYITEGEKKSLSLSQLGIAAVGIGGVWCGCKKGGGELIDDLAAIPLTSRKVYIVFDYDEKSRTRQTTAAAARRLAQSLRNAGAGEVNEVVLPPGPDGAKQGVDDFLVANGAEAFRELVEKARPVAERIKVVLGTDEFRVNAEAEAALINAPGLYCRGGQLTQVVRHGGEGKQRIRRPTSAPVVRPLPQPLLREELTRLVECVRLVKVGDKVQENKAPLPGHVVQTIHCRGVWEGIPHLAGVVAHPALLPDGSILATPGYDPESGLLLWLPDGLTVDVPDEPTQEDAIRSRDALLNVVSDFPFKTEAHRSAWLAGLLTPLARHAFNGSAPLSLFDANVAGAGKGLLADVAFLVVTGRGASVMGYTNDKEELRKGITTLAMDGDEMVLFDNITGSFGNDVLDRALTSQGWWKDRILGGNSQYDGPLNVTWYATGNNVSLRGDTSRRVMHVRLESPLEHPEDREEFKYPKLRQHVRQNRGPLLSAALTLLRAYLVAGRPSQDLTPWGSFEEWSDLIRGAVVWCEMADPADTREELRNTGDPEAAAWPALLAGIEKLDPHGKGLTVSDIILKSESLGNGALHEALCTICPGKGNEPIANTKSVGMTFHHHRGKITDGMALERMEGKTVRWRVVRSQDAGGTSGTNSRPTPQGEGGTSGSSGTKSPHSAKTPSGGQAGLNSSHPRGASCEPGNEGVGVRKGNGENSPPTPASPPAGASPDSPPSGFLAEIFEKLAETYGTREFGEQLLMDAARAEARQRQHQK
jgi:hypothetical protein